MSLFRKTLFFVLIVIGCVIFSQLVLTGFLLLGGADISVGSDIGKLINSMDNIIPFKIGIGLSNIIMFALSAILFSLWVRKQRFKPYFGLNKTFDWNWVGLSIVLLFVSYPMIAYSVNLISVLEFPDWMINMEEESYDTLMSILEMNSVSDLFLNMIIIAIVPAIAEELLFRGVIQKELSIHLASPNNPMRIHIAVWLSAFIFSAIHMQIDGFPPKMILGLILGYVYHYSKNLVYPMILHFVNNGMQVMMLYFSGEAIADLQNIEEPDIHWSIGIVSLMASIFIFGLIKSKSDKNVISA